MDDDDFDDDSDTSERTALSASDDDAVNNLADRHLQNLSLYESREKSVPPIHVEASLANVWQFILSQPASEFRRFTTTDFVPAETVSHIAQGTSYVVSRSRTSSGEGQLVVIKRILGEHDGVPAHDTLETVLRELRVFAHKPVRDNLNVARLIGYGAEDTGDHLSVYLVANFAPGGTLKDYLAEQTADESTAFLERAHFSYDIASGLAGLHACEIVHGDVKLANTLLFADTNKNGLVAKLSDFGCAIYEDHHTYVGSKVYTAPEIRRWKLVETESIPDFYACDVFALGLLVWETLQGGKPFIDLEHQDDVIVRLNALQRDDLLLKALQCFEDLPIQGAFPRRVIRNVLEGSLRDNPAKRMNCKAIAAIFKSDRVFSKSDRRTGFYFEPSKIPPLRNWSYHRTDNLARSIPFPLQIELFKQADSNLSGVSAATVASAYFDLAICHITGFGTGVSSEKFLDSLNKAATRGEPHASSMLSRMHAALQVPLVTTVRIDQSIMQVEYDLQRLPNDLYYSHRIRRHEQIVQSALTNSTFDVFSGSNLLIRAGKFTEEETVNKLLKILGDSSVDASTLIAVNKHFKREEMTQVFHLAARLGLIGIVRSFLEAGVDVNARDEYRATPLIAACRGGQIEVVRLLLSRGADSWKRQRNDISPFHWLMMFDDDEVHLVLEMLTKTHNSMVMDAVVSEPLEMLQHGLRLKWSPVHVAVTVRNSVVMKALIDAGASMKSGDVTPLDMAVANHCPEIVRTLLTYTLPSWQRTPLLHLADVSTLKLMLLHGNRRHENLQQTVLDVLVSPYGDVNQKDEDGYCPLAEAARESPCDVDLAVLECLISHGARCDIEVSKLMYCLLARNDRRGGAILDLLIEKGAVDVTRGLLTKAISCGNRDILDCVLRTGIDVNEKDKDGLSPLVCAVLFPKSAHAVKALISRGADVNAVFESSKSSRMSAFMMCLALPEGDGEMIDAFIEGGAPLVDAKGESIVHRVCQIPARVNGVHVLAHLFRNHPQTKSFINQTSGEMFKPIHNACFAGNLDAVLILLEHGAELDVSVDFNPVAMTERLALHPEERYVPFDRGAFRIDRWKRTAEAVLVELLDRCDPGHGRSMLHFATRVCNYDRVVELVERGAQPWKGDAKKITPMGMLPTKVLEYDDEQTDTPPEDYIREGLKIREYLQDQMVLRASQIDSFDAIDDAPAPITPETDSPFQLEYHYENKVKELTTASGYDHIETLEARFRLSESYMMQERWAEAEKLQLSVLEKIDSAAHLGSFGLGEIRSNLVKVLIALNKLGEAADHASISLVEATQELPTYTKPSERQETDVANAVDNALFGEMDRNRYFNTFCDNGSMRLALALFNHSLVIEAQGDNLGALRPKEIIIDVVREKSSDKEPHLRIMAGYLICNYFKLERWDDVQKNLTWCLAMLEFATSEHFPMIQSNLLHVANQFVMSGRWAQAADFYQRIHDCAIRSRGERSFYSTNALRLLAAVFEMQEKYREAMNVQSKRVDACKQVHGAHSIETQYEVLELAQMYGKQERHVECAILQRQVVDEFESFGPHGQEDLLKAKISLTKTLITQKKFDEAEVIANAVLTGFTALHGLTAQCTLEAMSTLGQVLNRQDRCDEAISLYKQVLEKQEDLHGEFHGLTLKALSDILPVYLRANLIEQAKDVSRRATEICMKIHGPESIETLTILYYSSGVHSQAGEIEKARDVKAQVLELERKIRPLPNKETLFTMTDLANDHFQLQESDKTIALQIEALHAYQGLENRNEVKIIETVYSLACSYHEAGMLQDARTRYEEAITESRSLLGDQDERTIEKLGPLIVLYTEMDEYELAKDPAYESLWFMEKNHGDDHPSTQQAREDVVIMKSLDEWKEAGRQAKKLVTSLEKTKGGKDVATIKAMQNLADCYIELNDYKGAEPLYRRVLEHYREHRPPTNKATLQAMASLVSTLKDLEKYSEALDLNEELLEAYTKTLGVDDDTTIRCTVTKANILYFQERYPEALALELQIVSKRTASLGADDSKTLNANESASKTYLALQKYDEAITYAKEVLRIRESLGIADEDDDMLDTIENLTEIYIAAKRWQDAKSMANRGLKARSGRVDDEGDSDVITALETLKTIAKGMEDKGWMSEIVSLIAKEEAAKEIRKSQWWRK